MAEPRHAYFLLYIKKNRRSFDKNGLSRHEKQYGASFVCKIFSLNYEL